MATLYFVRHAHAPYTPDPQRPLSRRGRRGAQRVADLLAPFPITALVASSERRAFETLAPLAKRLALPVQRDERLRERVLCAGRADDFHAAAKATWDDETFAHPGGESNRAARRRALRSIEPLRHGDAGPHVVVGTHGTLLTLLLQHFDERVGYHFWRSLSMPDAYVLHPNGDFERLQPAP